MKTGVDPTTRAGALRRLFTDPHFNRMDGLDIYIDDYGKPDPIPMAMLRMMNQARSLGLFSDENDESGELARREPDHSGPAVSAAGGGHEAASAEPAAAETATSETAASETAASETATSETNARTVTGAASDAGDATPPVQAAAPASRTDAHRS